MLSARRYCGPMSRPPDPHDPHGTASFGDPPQTVASAQPVAPSIAGRIGSLNRLVLVGACGVFISLFLEWGKAQFFGESFAGTDIPIELLNDTTPASLDSTPITYLLVPAVAAMLIGLFVKEMRWLSLVGAIGATLVGGWYLKAVQAVIDESGFSAGMTELVGIGTWICLASGAIGMVGGTLMLRDRPNTTVASDQPG